MERKKAQSCADSRLIPPGRRRSRRGWRRPWARRRRSRRGWRLGAATAVGLPSRADGHSVTNRTSPASGCPQSFGQQPWRECAPGRRRRGRPWAWGGRRHGAWGWLQWRQCDLQGVARWGACGEHRRSNKVPAAVVGPRCKRVPTVIEGTAAGRVVAQAHGTHWATRGFSPCVGSGSEIHLELGIARVCVQSQ